jgi:two-component system, LytTR family, sensor kinase
MMIDFLKRQANFARTEFWAFTTIFVFTLFFFITDNLDGANAMNNAPYRKDFEQANVPYSYYSNFFIPQFIWLIVMFVSFMFLNFVVIPNIVRRKSIWKNILFFVLTFLVSGLIFSICDRYVHAYRFAPNAPESAEWETFEQSILDTFSMFGVLLFYSIIKYLALYFLSKVSAIEARYRFITREAIIATLIWMVILLLMLISGSDLELLHSWMTLIPYAIFLYSFSFYKIIPKALQSKRPFLSYLMRTSLTIVVLLIPVLLLLMLITQSAERALNVNSLNTVFQLFITVPLTWVIFRRQQKGNEEVIVLKKELKQSTANIDFLRSQINPHFLFNALNTLYGTAIQENAERTSEGIQRLGDMMRFMLQENMQEKISLSREIDYLNNYIGLQRLRTNTNPSVQIHTNIEERQTMFQIAPMLLIPFVENAFKHGISFREPSHIKITLEIKDKTLYFDVYNSKHDRQHADPEKDKSGIGLENVRQRLHLLYPNQHELVIRDTSREFFVHLTIQLG